MSAAPDDGGHMESAAREADDGLGRDFLVSVWQADKGLPANLIQALAQTPDGFLWLGTHQGLVRFDGHSPVLAAAIHSRALLNLAPAERKLQPFYPLTK